MSETLPSPISLEEDTLVKTNVARSTETIKKANFTGFRNAPPPNP
jgi:hypothetical protein